ncbi:MAG TPA: TRAP transporter substrate-binding protein DctP [Bacillota bacterium]|nr:TRAP transporter substrate-binding protein DctP [Bacillota bacterium]
MKGKNMTVVWVVLILAAFGVGYIVRPAVAPAAVDPADVPEPVIEWTMQGIYMTGHPLFTKAQEWTEEVYLASGGRLKITLHPVGALVPAAELLSAVSAGTIDVGHSFPPWWIGTKRAFGLFCGQTVGMSQDEYRTWLLSGGGWELAGELYGQHNLHWIPFSNDPAETFLWAKQPIRVLADLEGMKVRAAGLSLDVFKRLGIDAHFIATAEIVPSLLKGVINAAEFLFLEADYAMGFHDAAKYAMMGERAPSHATGIEINRDRWNELPADLQAIVTNTALRSLITTYGEFRLGEAAAAQRLRDKGVTFVAVSDELNKQVRDGFDAVLDDEAAKDPFFARAWASARDFRTSYRETVRTLWPWE